MHGDIIVMSMRLCPRLDINVGSLPWLAISKSLERRKSSRRSPLRLVSLLPHIILCALLSQPAKNGRLLVLQWVTMFSSVESGILGLSMGR